MNVRPFRFRITAWYAGLLAGALLILGVSVYLGLERYLYGNAQRALAADCRTIGTQMWSQHPFKTPNWLETEIEEDYAPEINNHFIRVTLIGAGVVYVSGPPKDGSFGPSRIPLPSPDQERREGYASRATDCWWKSLRSRRGRRHQVHAGRRRS